MATWGTSIGAGTNLQDLSLLQMLVAAVNERQLPFGPRAAAPIAAPAAGDVVQSAEFWRVLQNQILVGDILVKWVDHTQTYEGNTSDTLFTDDAIWTMPKLRAAAGLAPTLYYGAGVRQSYADGGWRRLRPREIGGTGVVADLHYNPAVAGQIAYLVADASESGAAPAGYARYGSLGIRYQCQAPGNWTRYDGPTPVDVLDNTQLQPNSIDGNNTNFQATSLYGDYFGAHLFEELRLITDLLRWTLLYATNDGSATPRLSAGWVSAVLAADAYGSSGGGLTAAIAEANLVAGWGAQADSEYMPAALYTLVGAAGFAWVAGAFHADLGIRADYPSTLIAHKDSWFNYAIVPETVPPSIWDSNGDDVLEGQWHDFFDTGPTMAATVDLPTIGNAPAIPDPGNQGYQMTQMAGILKWNTVGGFVYCTAMV